MLALFSGETGAHPERAADQARQLALDAAALGLGDYLRCTPSTTVVPRRPH